MFYVLRETFDEDGNCAGYYVAIHEHDETPEIDRGPIAPTIEAADVAFHRDRGCVVQWREPDPDADPDVHAIGED